MSLQKIQIVKTDYKTAPDDLLHLALDFSDKMRKERAPNDPPIPRDLLVKNAREQDPHEEKHVFLAILEEVGTKMVVGNAVAGWFKPTAEGYESNKHIASINVSVLKEYRNQGIGKMLLKEVVRQVQENPVITSVFAGSWTEEGKKMCERYGGKLSSDGAENRLELKDVNWDMLHEWQQAGEVLGKKEGVTIQFFEECPDDIIEQYCMVYQETMNQQPLGEFDGVITITPERRRRDEEKNRKLGLKWYTFITREKDGAISGLTEMLFHPDMPYKAFQNLTGVKQEYRGRGLGKWLKAHMILWITKQHPTIETIVTGNDETNAPMLSINKRMGFKKHMGQSSYKFEKAHLAHLVLGT